MWHLYFSWFFVTTFSLWDPNANILNNSFTTFCKIKFKVELLLKTTRAVLQNKTVLQFPKLKIFSFYYPIQKLHKMFKLPVCIAPLFCFKYLGRASPKNNEKPMMNRFLDELRSTNCRLDNPTAAIIPICAKKILTWMCALLTFTQCLVRKNSCALWISYCSVHAFAQSKSG